MDTRGKEGFTLIELLIVVAIVAILSSLAVVNFLQAAEKSKRSTAKSFIAQLETAISMYKIDIATPNYLHAPMSIAAFKKGKHVLCEKPMATSLKDAKAMVKAAEEAKKRLMIHMSMRFQPRFSLMKKLIDQGVLGGLYYGKSSWLRRRGTPVIDFPSTGIMARGDWFVQKEKSGGGAPAKTSIEIPSQESVETSYHYFVSAIIGENKKMIASRKECLEVMKVLEVIKQSSKNKQFFFPGVLNLSNFDIHKLVGYLAT